MIGLDTNVLVRYLTQDDRSQARQATRILEDGAERGEVFFISHIVMCEIAWVLVEAYGCSRSEILSTLEGILRTAQFTFEGKERLWQALHDHRKGRADFADCLIGRAGSQAGCELTVTFDRALRGNRLFRVL